MLNYAKEKGIPVKATVKKPYSEDDNLMHISHEAGILEDPAYKPEMDMFTKIVPPQLAPDKETQLEIHFKDGIPVKVVNKDDKISDYRSAETIYITSIKWVVKMALECSIWLKTVL